MCRRIVPVGTSRIIRKAIKMKSNPLSFWAHPDERIHLHDNLLSRWEAIVSPGGRGAVT